VSVAKVRSNESALRALSAARTTKHEYHGGHANVALSLKKKIKNLEI
jgi:hypothetical protein